MIVLGIVGSPRKNGLTNRLVEAALKGAAAKGATVRKVYLVDYAIRPFTGSGGSVEANDYCPEELSNLCEEAEAIVLGAPVYWGDISGLTKDFMDSVSISSASASGKLALGTAIAGGSGKGLLSGIQSIYHYFYHKQFRAIDPAPASRFNLEAAVAQLEVSGAKLVDLAEETFAFSGETWDDRWPEVVAYYASVDYLSGDPVDEFMMLAEQLVAISTSDKLEEAKGELATARDCLARGDRAEAGRHAVRCYQHLYY